MEKEVEVELGETEKGRRESQKRGRPNIWKSERDIEGRTVIPAI